MKGEPPIKLERPETLLAVVICILLHSVVAIAATGYGYLESSDADKKYMDITDASGKKRKVKGVFTAVSYDGGRTWSRIMLISDDKPDREYQTKDTKQSTIGFTSAEPEGYMSACQGVSGLIHVISSWNYYAFNPKWLEIPPRAKPVLSTRQWRCIRQYALRSDTDAK
ncbi:MAG: hypothetical protein JSW47_13635 [Phycisphaerales bacterium]|nr:MAG: hypothetical protein JSW47_13635 [Phycisphaerales bacterium]